MSEDEKSDQETVANEIETNWCQVTLIETNTQNKQINEQ